LERRKNTYTKVINDEIVVYGIIEEIFSFRADDSDDDGCSQERREPDVWKRIASCE